MGDELAVINPAVTEHGGGGMAELRRALRAGSTVGQLTMAQRWATRAGKAAALSQLNDEEGVNPRG
jgi:hypothetical protein